MTTPATDAGGLATSVQSERCGKARTVSETTGLLKLHFHVAKFIENVIIFLIPKGFQR